MNRWITLLQPGQKLGDGSTGAPSPVWSGWAALRALAGAELDKVQQIAQKVSHLVAIAYQQGVEENFIVTLNDAGTLRTFQINFIEDPDELQRELRLYCMELGTSS